MADSILRLKVESQEYDNKLKQAAQGLTRYVDECRKVGGTLEVVEKETLDYVRALGQMDTTSRTATGKLAEMKKTFTELSAQYKQMTDAEKQSPFGKALAASLDQLKGRIQDSKSQLDDINKSINGGSGLSGALDSIASKFGMNIEQLTKFGGVLGAASAALKVSKDAFFASEQNIDEWGRVVASGESVYEGFLTALNTGDISGYLNNINTIINAAREAYNELDRLSTQKAIDNSRSKAQQTENERMRAMLRTGRYIAPNDGRKAAMAEGTILTDAQKQRIAQQLENGLKTANSIVRSEIDQTTKAINALYKEQASVLQMSSKEFRAGTSSMAEFDKRLEGYKNYVDFERQHTYNDGRSAVSHRDNAVNPYEQYKAWGVFKDDGKLFQKINDLINQRASLQSQNYGNIAQAYRSINTATKTTGGGGGGRSGGGKTETIKTEEQLNNEEIQKLTQEYIKASDDRRKAIEGEIKTLQDRNAEIKRLMEAAQGKAAPDGSLKALSEELSKLQKERQLLSDPIDIELHDQAIKDVQDEIDRLNGKKVEVELAVDNRTPFEKLTDSLKIEISEENMQVDTTTLQTLMKTAMQNGIDGLDPNFSALQEKMRDGMNIPDSTWEELQTQINEKLKDLGIEPIKIDFKTGNISNGKQENMTAKAMEKFNGDFSKVTGGVSSIVSGIQQMGVDIPNEIQNIFGVLSGISSIMTGITAILTLIEIDTKTTAAASVTDALIPFARGGIVPHAANGYFVPGNNYSGDTTPIMANAGELVLNKAQQSTLAQNLQGSGGGNFHLVGRLAGEDIIISAERAGQRMGYGQLMFWKGN